MIVFVAYTVYPVACCSDSETDRAVMCADSGQQQQRGNYLPVTDSSSDGRLRQLRNDSLSLRDAKADDAGFYLCHASNRVGADLSKVIRLVVHSK